MNNKTYYIPAILSWKWLSRWLPGSLLLRRCQLGLSGRRQRTRLAHTNLRRLQLPPKPTTRNTTCPEILDQLFEHQGHQSKPSIQRTRLNEAKSPGPKLVPWKLYVGPQITLFTSWLFWSQEIPYSSSVNMPFCSIKPRRDRWWIRERGEQKKIH